MSILDDFDFGDDSGSNGYSSGGAWGFAGQLLDSAATLTNTALISNANPVNAALLTNQPISTPYVQVGSASTQSNLLLLGGLALLGVLAFLAIEKE